MGQIPSILLVDDEEEFVLMLASYIRSHGFEVETALDASQALPLIDENTFDLIITDINLPGMNGIELIKKSREKKTGIPAIVITAYPAQWSQEEACKIGVLEYMVKPLDPEELIRVINRSL